MSDAAIDVSVVIPCLNEEETVGNCVREAREAMKRANLAGEVIVADNASTDGSAAIAAGEGARVISVANRGYGNALLAGIREARGRYVIMGDADGSYDFNQVPQFVEKLEEGFDIVQGCRLPIGGGQIMPGAMPMLHRAIGNPALSALARRMFRVSVHDVYCGLRGFRRDYVSALALRCGGMEFATEMIIKSSMNGARIAEVPVVLRPDGRTRGRSHLNTVRDGWRTLRLYLLFSPRWLFLAPGTALIALGIVAYSLVYSGVRPAGVRLDAHTLLFASLAILLGVQAIIFSVLAKTFAIGEGLLPIEESLDRFYRTVTLERAITGGTVLIVIGLVLLSAAVAKWRSVHFGDLDYSSTMRWVIPGFTLTALGVQVIFASFFAALLLLRPRS